MTTVQQTGSIDLGANNTAAKTATNYITADSTGIQVHNVGDTSDYVQITSDGLDVYNDGVNAARFGSDGARIGKKSDPHIEVYNDSLLFEDVNSARLISMTTDPSSTEYYHLSFVGDGESRTFRVDSSEYIEIPARSFSSFLVLLNGIPTSKFHLYTSTSMQSNKMFIQGISS